jgi:hypothetical protein
MRKLLLGTLLLVLAAPTACAQSGSEEVDSIRKAIERIESSADRRWEQIPWVPTLTEARKLSATTKLPIFLFTQEGNLSSGRC